MTFNIDAYLDRQRERFEMNAAALYLAELLARNSELQAMFLARLEDRTDFKGEILLLQNRGDRFNDDFNAGGDPERLANELLEIEEATSRLNWRISEDDELGPIFERLQELRNEYEEERDECREQYSHHDFQPLFEKHYTYLTGTKPNLNWGNFDLSMAPFFTPIPPQ